MDALSPRLETVLDFCRSLHTPDCGVLADIGTDHAYLPIAAIQQGVCKRAIACDLHPGPLDIATGNIRNAGFGSQIEVRLGDGLQPLLPGEADCIVIAGMGGMRILDIIFVGLDQAEAARRLILQPQRDTMILRKFLHSNGFEIEGERLVREVVSGKEHFYVVLAARYAGEVETWNERGYFLGKYLLKEGSEDFLSYMASEREKLAAYISSIRDEAALTDARKRMEWLS